MTDRACEPPETGNASPVPIASDPPPPFGGRWSCLYLAVAVALVVDIVLFWLFTRAFS